jgi:hypothetical protein
METVENMQGLGTFLTDKLQIGFPHVRADEDDLRGDFLADHGKESLEGLDRSLFPDPKQAGDADIDLINQRQVLVPFGILDFIHPDGIDLTECPVVQPERDDVLDGVENLVPGSAKRHGRFLPRKPPRPAGQKQHVRFGKSAFAITPRDLFDDNRVAAPAIDAPHGVQQKNQEAPERNKLETPFGELIVSGRVLMAARTNRFGALARTHGDFNALVIGTEASLLVNESRKTMTPI